MSIVEPPQPVRGANYITIACCIVTYLERPRSYQGYRDPVDEVVQSFVGDEKKYSQTLEITRGVGRWMLVVGTGGRERATRAD